MIVLKCLVCGKKFQVILSRRQSAKFCSRKCRDRFLLGRTIPEETRIKISRSLKGRSSPKKGKKVVTVGKLVNCLTCKNEVIQKTKTIKLFCSDNCRARLYRKRYPEKYRLKYKKWYEKIKRENPDFNKERYCQRKNTPQFQEQRRRWSKKQYQKLRSLALKKYGGRCVCCGESEKEFLGVDYVGGGGAKHRKELKNVSIYRWLYKNNYPKGFRILCHNCNLTLGFYGYCPHKKI